MNRNNKVPKTLDGIIKPTRVIKSKRRIWFKPIKFRSLLKRSQKNSKKVALFFIIFICILSFSSIYIEMNKTKKDNNSSSSSSEHKLPQGTPDFNAVSPIGKNISDLGGWTRVSPESSDATYAYVDKINGIQIIVSEQILPDKFKKDTTNQIKLLAEGFNADEKITIGDNTIYIGTASNGVQSVIFTKKDLLILIKSNDRISTGKWAQYIESLE